MDTFHSPVTRVTRFDLYKYRMYYGLYASVGFHHGVLLGIRNIVHELRSCAASSGQAVGIVKAAMYDGLPQALLTWASTRSVTIAA